MDDIDREIKEIQLKRERLALEREMALHGVATTAAAAAVGIATPFNAGAKLLALWWKKLLLLVLLAAAVAGGVAWKMEQNRQQESAARAAEYERWSQGRAGFIAKQCPGFKCSEAQKAKADACFGKAKGILDRQNCVYNECTESSEHRALSECQEKAGQEYDQRNPR